jgi:hypothetical protein
MSDELLACWAAMVAFVEDVHAPQDQLSEAQWKAAERVLAAIPELAPTIEDHILAIALGVMLGEIDAPDLADDDWTVADRMLADYTQKVEAQA